MKLNNLSSIRSASLALVGLSALMTSVQIQSTMAQTMTAPTTKPLVAPAKTIAAPTAKPLATTPPAANLVKAGTVFKVKLQQKISTANAKDLQKFTLKEQAPLFGGNPILKNSTIEGHVEDVVKAQRGKKASLHLVFDDIILKNKQRLPINAILVDTKLEQKTQGTFLRNAAYLTAGAVAGHYLGQKAGLPGGSGVAAATAFVFTQPGGEVVLNKGTDFKLKLKSDLVVK
jgi:hypothetical protein